MEITEEYKAMGASIDTESGSAPRQWIVTFEQDEAPAQQMPLLARDAAGIPIIYESHPYDPWLYVKNKNSRYLSALCYQVDVYYTSIADPLQIPAEITWTDASTNEPIDKDKDGKPITNSSHETYDPPIAEDFHDVVLRIVRNEANFDPIIANDYKNSVNSDTIFGFQPGVARVKVFEGVRSRAANLFFYNITYEIQFRKDGWKRRPLDQGFRTIKVDDNGVPVLTDDKYQYEILKDANGKTLTQPRLLDGNGQLLKKDVPAVNMEYETLDPLPYADLNLEVSL